MPTDCTICGEDHADAACPTPFCAACWTLDPDGCCTEYEPATAAEWIEAGRPERRRVEPVDLEEAYP